MKNLVSGKKTALNSVYSMLGQGLPVLVALVTMPLLITNIGADKLGVLSIAWVLIGYGGVFDFGLGRALTKLLSEKISSNETDKFGELIWTSLVLMLVFGCVGSFVFFAFASFLANGVLNVPEKMRSDTLTSLYYIAISIPVISLSSGLRGVLEANQLFKGISVIRFFLGISTFIGPLIVSYYSDMVYPMVIMLVVARFSGLVSHVCLCYKLYPFLFKKILFKKSWLLPLFKFGSWMTLVNLLSPLLVNIERLLIGSIMAVSFVAYYSTPYDMATKLWIISGALVGTLLPAFSAAATQGADSLSFIFKRAFRYNYVIMYPISLVVVAFSYELLQVWIGDEFAIHGSAILELIVIGVFFNSFAQVSYVFLQGVGRPDLMAKILLVQIPFYIPVLYLGIKAYGIKGAAIVWLIRVLFDTLMFLYYSTRKMNIYKNEVIFVFLLFSFSIVTFIILININIFIEKIILFAFIILFMCIIFIKKLILKDEINSLFIRFR